MDGRQAAATLGVDPRATRDEIRRAFRARAKVLHPDAGVAGSTERFIALRQAAERLLADAPESSPSAGAAPDSGCFDRRVAGDAGLGDRIDLTDTSITRPHRRPRPQPARPAGRPATGRPATGRPVVRDARGLSFEDHLAAALAAG